MKRSIRIILSISFIFYLFVIVCILFLRSSFSYPGWTLIEYIKNSSNIIPFKNISRYIRALFDESMNMSTPITNLGGNIVLFLPMGIYIPLFFNKINRIGSYFVFMITLIFVAEAIQLITRRGCFDIDDFILNMIGGLIGFGIWKLKIIQKLLK